MENTAKHLENQKQRKIGEMFDRIAPRYDLLNTLLSAYQDQRWRIDMINSLPRPLGASGALLDVATGTGDVLKLCHQMRPEYSTLAGVDISKGMLKKAEAKLKKEKISARLTQMSASNLTIKENSFDAITIAFGLRNVVERQKALECFHHTLKPRGQLFILEFFNSDKKWFSALFRFYFHHILPKIGGIVSDRAAYEYLPKSVDHFCTKSTLSNELDASGFNEIFTRSYLFGSCQLLCYQKQSF